MAKRVKRKSVAKGGHGTKREPKHDPAQAPAIAPRGRTGLRETAGRINEEINLRLVGRRANKIYREMHDNNAILGGIYNAIELLIRQTLWDMKADSTDPQAQLGSMIAETSLQDMDNTWQELVSEILTMGPFGHAVMEPVYKYRRGDHELAEMRSRHNDGAVGLRYIRLRAQESLWRWQISRHDEILAMEQRVPNKGDHRFIAMERALLFRTRAIKNNPEGRSWYRNGYRSYWFIKRIQEHEGIGIERHINGLPDYQLPARYFSDTATAEEKKALAGAEKMVTRVRYDEYGGIVRPSEVDSKGKPTGHKFSLVSGGGRRPDVFNTVIKRYESRLAITLLGEFVLLGMDKVGSFALSSDKTDLFAVALQAVLMTIEDVFNRHLFPRLMRFNGIPVAASPRMFFRDIEKKNLLEFGQSLQAFNSAGVLNPDQAIEDHVRDLTDLPLIGEVSEQQAQDAIGERMEATKRHEGLGGEYKVERSIQRIVPIQPRQMRLALGGANGAG